MTQPIPLDTAAQGRPLTIKIKINAKGSKWEFSRPNSAPIKIKRPFNQARLSELRAGLQKCLEKFQRTLAQQLKWPLPSAEVDEALLELHGYTREVSLALFGKKWSGVKAIFHDTYGSAPHRQSVPLLVTLHVKAPVGDLIPLEYLPVFDPVDQQLEFPSAFDNRDRLMAFIRRFLGFVLVVERIPPKAQRGIAPFLESNPQLPLKFFQHAGFAGVKKEIKFLEKHRKVELIGPWPKDELLDEDVTQHFVKHIHDPFLRFTAPRDLRSDQIQHFACHSDTTNDNAEDHSLTLAHAPEYLRHVTVREIKRVYALLGSPPDCQAFPLIFFNSCGSALSHPHNLTSFLKFFLEDNENRGFIGTEAPIPDEVASFFSIEFYRKLLDNASLAMAFHHARYELLRKYNNPLGILYTLYADPDIRLKEHFS
ncbi:MAG: CHAT domain-containing protein [Acidobacteria bacterium]|nr:CHAT domain-containing protein [Acidobacteriota bacterium]